MDNNDNNNLYNNITNSDSSYIMDSVDSIREPDIVKTDRLIEDDRSDFEKQIEEATYRSIQDINQQQISNKQYEEKIFEEYKKETIRRKELFSDLLSNLNRLKRFDKEIREILDIIEPVIESYCDQYIQICEFDKETYEKIFHLLGKIRTDKKAIELLKNIIVEVNLV
jgi:hypothetical protein